MTIIAGDQSLASGVRGSGDVLGVGGMGQGTSSCVGSFNDILVEQCSALNVGGVVESNLGSVADGVGGELLLLQRSPEEVVGPSLVVGDDLMVVRAGEDVGEVRHCDYALDQAACSAAVMLAIAVPTGIGGLGDSVCGASLSSEEGGAGEGSAASDGGLIASGARLRGLDLSKLMRGLPSVAQSEAPPHLADEVGRVRRFGGDVLVGNVSAVQSLSGLHLSFGVSHGDTLAASSPSQLRDGVDLSVDPSDGPRLAPEFSAAGTLPNLPELPEDAVSSRVAVSGFWGSMSVSKLPEGTDVRLIQLHLHSMRLPNDEELSLPGVSVESLPKVDRDDMLVAGFGDVQSVGLGTKHIVVESELSSLELEPEKIATMNPFHVSPSFTAARAMQERTFRPVVSESASSPVNVPLWREISDVVRRVSSQDPSHLAMNLRLSDGSVVDLDLRVVNSGLHATFKTESRELLATLESRWSEFMERNHPNLRLVSSVFEGNVGLDLGFSHNGNGQQRETLEDFVASSGLSDFSNRNRRSSASTVTPPPPPPTPNRLSIYA